MGFTQVHLAGEDDGPFRLKVQHYVRDRSIERIKQGTKGGELSVGVDSVFRVGNQSEAGITIDSDPLDDQAEGARG